LFFVFDFPASSIITGIDASTSSTPTAVATSAKRYAYTTSSPTAAASTSSMIDSDH